MRSGMNWLSKFRSLQEQEPHRCWPVFFLINMSQSAERTDRHIGRHIGRRWNRFRHLFSYCSIRSSPNDFRNLILRGLLSQPHLNAPKAFSSALSLERGKTWSCDSSCSVARRDKLFTGRHHLVIGILVNLEKHPQKTHHQLLCSNVWKLVCVHYVSMKIVAHSVSNSPFWFERLARRERHVEKADSFGGRSGEHISNVGVLSSRGAGGRNIRTKKLAC